MTESIKYDRAELKTQYRVNEYNLERVFNLYKRSGGKHYFYNLLRKIDYPKDLASWSYNMYMTTPGDTWTLISHKHYNQIELWWLIAGINQIDDTFTPIQTGTELKIPTPDYTRQILDDIATQL